MSADILFSMQHTCAFQRRVAKKNQCTLNVLLTNCKMYVFSIQNMRIFLGLKEWKGIKGSGNIIWYANLRKNLHFKEKFFQNVDLFDYFLALKKGKSVSVYIISFLRYFLWNKNIEYIIIFFWQPPQPRKLIYFLFQVDIRLVDPDHIMVLFDESCFI